MPKIYDTQVFKILHELDGRLVSNRKGKPIAEINAEQDFEITYEGTHYFVRDWGFQRPNSILEVNFDDPDLLYDEDDVEVFNPTVNEDHILVCLHVYELKEDKFHWDKHKEILLMHNDSNLAYMLQQARERYPILHYNYRFNIMSDDELKVYAGKFRLEFSSTTSRREIIERIKSFLGK